MENGSKIIEIVVHMNKVKIALKEIIVLQNIYPNNKYVYKNDLERR